MAKKVTIVVRLGLFKQEFEHDAPTPSQSPSQ